MDYANLNKSIQNKVMAALALINNPEVDPEIRELNQEILFREVGESVYNKVYNMNAYDMEIQHTTGPGIDDRHFGLAKVAAASVSTGVLGLGEYVKNYLDTMASKAQEDAMVNAKQSGKFPTVTRKMRGETCKWCESLAGTYTNPDSEVFKRHGGCDCSIETQGYKSRNGLLKNYKSSPDNKSVLSSGGIRTEDAAQKAMEDALNAGNISKAQQIVDGIQDPTLKTGLQGTIDAIEGKPRKVIVDPITKKISYA